MNLQKFADTVRKNGWLTRQTGSLIEMYKRIDKKRNKIVSVLIRKVSDRYVIEFPKHPFISKVATFAPVIESEERLCRAATVIGSIYESLKGTEICNMIENWNDFVIVNQYNKNVPRDWAKEKLKKWQQFPEKK